MCLTPRLNGDNMKDKEFLQWIHNRLHYIHEESVNVDYMHRLRAIIDRIPEDQHTPNVCSIWAPKSVATP